MSVSTAQSPGNAQLLSELDGPRACGLYDLAGVLDNANLVMRVTETPPKLPTIGTDWAHVYNHENLDNIRLISHNGKVVSSVAIFPSVVKTPRGEVSVGGINCFATNPDYRRMGLGEAVLLDAHEKMRANGHHIGLLSTVIHDYYRKFGWESAGRRRRFVFDRGNIGLLPEPTGLDVTEHWQPHSEEMRALHRQKPVFSPRSTGLHEWLAAHKFERVVVAKRDEVVVAYVGAAQDRITEYAGGVDDVAALIRVAFTELDDPRRSTTTRSRVERVTLEMKVWTPDTSDGLPGFLNNLGIPSALEYNGMIVMLDAPGLLESLGLREVNLQRTPNGWIARRGPKQLALTDHELVKLVFGPEKYADFAPDLFPIDFYQWPLDIV